MQVRREATVVALEDCYVLQLTARDFKGMHVDAGEARAQAVVQVLQRVTFFKTLSKSMEFS